MSNSEPRHTSEIDASNDKVEPVGKKKKVVKSTLRSAKDIIALLQGRTDPSKKTQTIVNPPMTVPQTYPQSVMAERQNLGDLKMIKNTYASLIKEVAEPVEISESSKTFLELAAYHSGVDYDDLEQIFIEGVQYGLDSEDEYRSPEEYGNYFVNKTISNMLVEGTHDIEVDQFNDSPKEVRLKQREKVKRTKEKISRDRSLEGYAPEVATDDDDEAKRYIVTFNEDPTSRTPRVSSYKVRAFNASQAHLFALDMHKEFLGGKLPRNRDHWDVAINSDRSAVGTEGMNIAKRRKKKAPKPKTARGKFTHWIGRGNVEASEAPKVKKKKTGGSPPPRRKRVADQQRALPPSHQLTYDPKDHGDEED